MIDDVAGPDETRHVPDEPAGAASPDVTQHVPDGPLLPASAGAGATATKLPTFGRYQTLQELGAGAMGTVYRARDPMLGREVAIKALHAQNGIGIRERFEREARAIGAVIHPSILAVHDVNEQDRTPYLVMELATGGTLRDRIKAGPVDATTVREVGVQMARALAAAHAANIIHRDVKPANILCSQPGTWKLADFGIARTPDSTLTIEGQFLGSPSYAAPESLRAGQFSPASDVYSLGATLYEALAGTPPHGDHDMQSLVRKLEQDPVPLSARCTAPPALADAIMAALARDPAQRPTAEALADRLARATDAVPVVPHVPHVPVAPAPVSPAPVATSSRGLRWAALGLAAIAAIAIVMATRGRSSSTSSLPAVPAPFQQPQPGEPAPVAGAEEEPRVGDPDGEPQVPGMPMVVDQYGNPVDEDTARAILEQMERDARAAQGGEVLYEGNGRGRGRGKRKRKDD